MDFSGGPVVKDLPANVGDTDLIPHALGQLSPGTITTKACVLKGLWSTTREVTTMRSYTLQLVSPPLPTRESPCTAKEISTANI